MAPAISTARKLRRYQTDAEPLWFKLRDRRLLGLKFRRQMPVDKYVVDLCCEPARLIIELDGGQHAERSEADCIRTAALETRGYLVLRFWNNDVLANTDGVIAAISTCLSQRERALGRSCSQHDLNSAGRCSPDAGGAKRRKGEGDEARDISPPHPSHRYAMGPFPLPSRERERDA